MVTHSESDSSPFTGSVPVPSSVVSSMASPLRGGTGGTGGRGGGLMRLPLPPVMERMPSAESMDGVLEGVVEEL